jgi:hypothetical protein
MVIVITHSFGDHKMVEQWQQCLLSVHKNRRGSGIICIRQAEEVIYYNAIRDLLYL